MRSSKCCFPTTLFYPFPSLRLFLLILNQPLCARSVASSHLPSPLSNKAWKRGREADDIICLLKIEEHPECKVVKCATMFSLFLTGTKEMYSALYRINKYTSSNFHSCGKAIPYSFSWIQMFCHCFGWNTVSVHKSFHKNPICANLLRVVPRFSDCLRSTIAGSEISLAS